MNIKKVIALYVVIVLLFFSSVVYLASALVDEVKDVGLKNIVNEVWCGENKEC